MAEIKRHENESSSSALRRFTKKVQQAGLLSRAKKLRFHERKLSDFKKKKNALRRIARRREVEKLWKLGKIKER
ncbi:MAG: 30S ribosomal protein S21 [Candidatus Niyogibacteria bacterium RIFCSPLOWO2_01_FULL_45_48]|uniref:Small ribosomal subunit protein bS21 n=2 Tax=Candidatus Niyogiibacteriota TaxID=1817912 RepID=A0A1G2EZN9_9BACT|nr:MAG: 30S ribosomal protein S21 [Candidatus Niyogibacteria bacterium RIFCSPLOWO2_01_FULL_45_48]OGZ31213.1 MAG: 30S ribosomal protein S21 [Candidatus Niyogibacteria bacterium RIFCSPLOWO2_02_FULL_45_13]